MKLQHGLQYSLIVVLFNYCNNYIDISSYIAHLLYAQSRIHITLHSSRSCVKLDHLIAMICLLHRKEEMKIWKVGNDKYPKAIVTMIKK